MGGIGDGVTGQGIGLLHGEVRSVATIQNPIGISIPTARGEHGAREAGPVVIHVVQPGALQMDWRDGERGLGAGTGVRGWGQGQGLGWGSMDRE